MPRKYKPGDDRYTSVRFHPPTGQHFTWDRLGQRRVYLGRDPGEARLAFDRLPPGPTTEAGPGLVPGHPLTINGLLLAYLKHRQADRPAAGMLGRLLAAIRFMRPIGGEPAASFRALALTQVRDRMLRATGRRGLDRKRARGPGEERSAKPLSRRYVNWLVNELKAAWVWGAAMELVPDEAAGSHHAVRSLKLGRGGTESVRIRAVDPQHVELTLPELNPVVAAMVRLQLATGMRPGEVCRLRPCDVSRDPKAPIPLPGHDRDVAAVRCGETVVWVACPATHKTLHAGKPRVVMMTARSQAVLSPFLEGRDPTSPCFSPAEGIGRSKVAGRTLGSSYTTASYGRAIAAAIDRVNRRRSASSLAPIPHWRPNQLRHRHGTDAANRHNRAAAATLLGNSLRVIDVYIDDEIPKAAWLALGLE